MGNVYPGIPHDLVLRAKAAWSIPALLETGTHIGNSALWAKDHFRDVMTIEAAEGLHAKAKERLSGTQVELFLGHSLQVLPSALSKAKEAWMFWLDSHWSSADTYGEGDECPVLEELREILKSPYEHVVLIDDARFFLAPPPPPHRQEFWPSYPQISSEVQRLRPSYETWVLDDVIWVFPRARRAELLKFHYQTLAERTGAQASAQTGLAGKVKRRVARLIGIQ